ncbi:hypothetical protein MOQ_000040, partial [Trypanosoma cruzi marinkellei]
VDELGEEYRSATHERAVEALAAEEDAARGHLAGAEQDEMRGLCRDAVESEERAVRHCLERGEAAAVDELGEEYRSATHERAVEALAAEEDAARGDRAGAEQDEMRGFCSDGVKRLVGAGDGFLMESVAGFSCEVCDMLCCKLMCGVLESEEDERLLLLEDESVGWRKLQKLWLRFKDSVNPSLPSSCARVNTSGLVFCRGGVLERWVVRNR